MVERPCVNEINIDANEFIFSLCVDLIFFGPEKGVWVPQAV
jgi:hypothetical protein